MQVAMAVLDYNSINNYTDYNYTISQVELSSCALGAVSYAGCSGCFGL